ncbi:MAG: hypothetical protein KBC22_01920 [Candidatus Pacebacteria bacterium]|nr:hypothetical protein [Candidatus Paceibacterota bacterium]
MYIPQTVLAQTAEQQAILDDILIFGDGETPGEMGTAITNVPVVTWNDQLSFRLRADASGIQIFGVSVEDFQSGNVNIADFIIQNVGSIDFNLNNISPLDLFTGNIFIEGMQDIMPGNIINDIEFFYDFFYDVRAEVNLNGQTYDTIKVFFGRNPENLTYQIAEFTNTSGTLTINERVFNDRNDNDNELNKVNMFIGRPYYAGIYGVNIINGVPYQETIAIKRLHTYVNDINNAGRVVTNWSAGPYMSVTNTGVVPANTVTFNLAGQVQVQNQTRQRAQLKFGYDSRTFRPIQNFAAPTSPSVNQNFTFQKTMTNYYADADTFEVGRIEPNKMYYAGMYEGQDLVYFFQVGRTPDILDSEEEVPITGDPSGDTGGGALFTGQANPFADLEQDLSTGIVPCDGLNVSCDYNKAIELIQRLMKFIFILIIPIAAIAFTYAGFLLLFQGSNPEKRKHARDIIIKVVIGIAIVLAAWLIVRTVLVSLGVTQDWALIDLGN